MSERTMARTDASTKNDFRHPTRPVTPSLVPHAVSRGEVLRAQWDLRDIGLDAPPDRIAAAVREADAEHGDGHVTTPAEVLKASEHAGIDDSPRAAGVARILSSVAFTQGLVIGLSVPRATLEGRTFAHELAHVAAGRRGLSTRVFRQQRQVDWQSILPYEAQYLPQDSLLQGIRALNEYVTDPPRVISEEALAKAEYTLETLKKEFWDREERSHREEKSPRPRTRFKVTTESGMIEDTKVEPRPPTLVRYSAAIQPPPTLTPYHERPHIDPGFAYTQHQVAVKEMLNSGNSWWVRGGMGLLAVASGPLAFVEEHVTRATVNTVLDMGTGIGEHAARAKIWADQGEYAEATVDALSAVRDASVGFVVLAGLAEPLAARSRVAVPSGRPASASRTRSSSPAAAIPEHLNDAADGAQKAFLERGVFFHLETDAFVVRIGGPNGSYAAVLESSEAQAQSMARTLASRGQSLLRRELALRPEWQPDLSSISIYRIPGGTPVIAGVANPQALPSGVILPGGAAQYAFPAGALRATGITIPVTIP